MSYTAEKPNLVLSIIQKLSFEDVEPFIASLRGSGCRAEIVFFASHLADTTARRLRDAGVQLLPFKYFRVRMRRPILLLWPLWRWRFARMRTYEGKVALAKRVFFIFNLRYVFAHELLASRPGRYARVLLSDCRDVIFQSDPFAWEQERGVHSFLEGEGRTIATCPGNRQMITEGFGEKILETLGSREPACAGVTIGDADAVRDYCRLQTELACGVEQMRMVSAVDQGIHNYIFHRGLLPDLHLHKNGEGMTLTMGSMKPEEIRRDEAGQVLLADGRVAPILHQYDRHSELAAQLRRKFAGVA